MRNNFYIIFLYKKSHLCNMLMEELSYSLLYNVFQGSSRVVKEIGNATKDTLVKMNILFLSSLKHKLLTDNRH
jgi:hypothetical protein